ncbi:MAG: glycoside hydrolase family 3 C-terminal domain-containing protein, partial [Clostridia bacterium]|nr:glycoside hydrolase family 3 C-terminal domain-containing protein [Clostridia bacterium]
EIASDCAVLLKNDGVLPLNGSEKLYVCGDLFDKMRYQGAGSSMIHPTRVTSPKEAFDTNQVELAGSADSADTILIFAGLTDEYESEGGDREHMRLPEEQLTLIRRMAETGKKTAVVLYGGSPVELPFFEQVGAILYMGLPGQNGGTATYDLLYGKKNPSGKLAQTWPLRYEDVPNGSSFGKGVNEVYAEGTEVGYRYYGKYSIPVRFPFGYGLSYTAFEKSEWTQNGGLYQQTIRNTGKRGGSEVAMLFISGELRGFKKVFLLPGESRTVSILPEPVDETEYSDALSIPAEPKRYPVTLESRFTDLKQTFMGRILFNAVLSVADKQTKEAERLPEGEEKENKRKGALFLRRILESNSPRSMSMTAGSSLPYNFAQGFVELTNGHLIKGAKCFLSNIQVPKLPKEEQK